MDLEKPSPTPQKKPLNKNQQQAKTNKHET